MMQLDTVVHAIQGYGLLILFPLAVLEGPIVTVIAAYFAQLGLMNVVGVYTVCVIADLAGDAALYGLGLWAPGRFPVRWLLWLGITQDRLARLEAHFRERGPRTLLLGKLTHSAGFAVLLAAGASRMRFATFLWYNLLATLPKTLLFVVIGYSFGAAYKAIDSYIFRGSLILLAALATGGAIWLLHRRRSAR
ncbi:MAG: DedA family protein [Paracoccaceae bacterium]